ncbi:MAG: UDP-N-acetylglucosamine 2-epimerase (hydrolyzing) [Rhodospirillales bacterium]|nr:UDP-N-acetylglucosamine 2-epimerase (hydrolyzing) [Rhodospirillales bacterium]
MIRILSVSSSRADVTILNAVWRALAERVDCDLHVFATGMHMAAGGQPVEGLPHSAGLHRGGMDLSGDAGAKAAAAMAAITRDAGRTIAEVRPDAVLLVGDRLDMIPAALAALPANVPLVHVHGGEITEGAIDDRIRHAMTKLSHLHCVSSSGAAARVAAMGEEAWRIHVTGAPALDTLLAVPELDADTFLRETRVLDLPGDPLALRLVTVHPETNADDPQAPLTAVLAALEARPAPTLLTWPNSDPGGEAMRIEINRFATAKAWAMLVNTLGPRLYASALRHAAMMVGNSSSGLIEAGLFGLPVINVGDRQKGRERGPNVIDVANHADAVLQALDRLGPRPPRFRRFSPYGDGKAAPRIADVLTNLPPWKRLVAKTGLTDIGAQGVQSATAG